MKLDTITTQALCMAKPGMWGELLVAGRLVPHTLTLEIERAEFDRIVEKHYGRDGIGTVVHRVLRPVAKAIDRVTGTNLEECGHCALRELKLNNL